MHACVQVKAEVDVKPVDCTDQLLLPPHHLDTWRALACLTIASQYSRKLIARILPCTQDVSQVKMEMSP